MKQWAIVAERPFIVIALQRCNKDFGNWPGEEVADKDKEGKEGQGNCKLSARNAEFPDLFRSGNNGTLIHQ